MISKKIPLVVIILFFITLALIFSNFTQSIAPGVIIQGFQGKINVEEPSKNIENHMQISIQGNNELLSLASMENWTGDGTELNPFLISGYIINGSDKNFFSKQPRTLISLNNTSYYCRIINNQLSNANDSIIYLENTSNIQIMGNDVSKGYCQGITVESSEKIILSDNKVFHNDGNGVLIRSCNDSLIFNNTIFGNNGNGTLQFNSQNINISNNDIYNNNGNGVVPSKSRNNVISNNIIYANNVTGITVDNSHNNSICDNKVCYTNNYEGIYIVSSENNSIFRNTVYNNSRIGISLSNSARNIVFDNSVFYSTRHGILISDSYSNTISSNIVYNTMYYDGIQLYYSTNNTVSENIIYRNNRDGILQYFSYRSLIVNNTIYNNKGTGISFHGSNNNTLDYNLIYKNNEGMSIFSGDSNNFHNNIICKSNNNEFQIYSNDNTIIQNEFHGNINGTNINDGGERNSFSNNYYSSWRDPDLNIDGIVDNPYLIEGSASNQDMYPHTNPFSHNLMPPYLYFPTGGEILDKAVTIQWEPSFDTFGHDLSYSLYYSIDGGQSWDLLITNLTTSSYLWNISSMLNGQNYMIKVVVSCTGDLTLDITSDSTFIIRNHLLSPLIISHPQGGTKLKGVAIISWTSVNDSLDHQIMYSVYFSSNNGESWTSLALEYVNTSYEWDTTLVRDGSRYKIMITAECSEGESISGFTTGTFSVQNMMTPVHPLVFFLIPVFIGIIIWGFNHSYAAKFRKKVPLNLEDLRLSTCLGSFSEDGWRIKAKTDNCPFDEMKLRSMIEISAALYQHGKYGAIYGPFPQIMAYDTLERQWQFISYSFISKREFFVDLRFEGESDEIQMMVLLFYERQFEELITLEKKAIQKCLNSITKNLESRIENFNLWLAEIGDQIIQMLSL